MSNPINAQTAEDFLKSGFEYLVLQNYKKAIADFTEAIRLDPRPRVADAYIGRGNAYAGENDYEKAIADYEVALKINPNHVQANEAYETAKRAMGY